MKFLKCSHEYSRDTLSGRYTRKLSVTRPSPGQSRIRRFVSQATVERIVLHCFSSLHRAMGGHPAAQKAANAAISYGYGVLSCFCLAKARAAVLKRYKMPGRARMVCARTAGAPARVARPVRPWRRWRPLAPPRSCASPSPLRLPLPTAPPPPGCVVLGTGMCCGDKSGSSLGRAHRIGWRRSRRRPHSAGT